MSNDSDHERMDVREERAPRRHELGLWIMLGVLSLIVGLMLTFAIGSLVYDDTSSTQDGMEPWYDGIWLVIPLLSPACALLFARKMLRHPSHEP